MTNEIESWIEQKWVAAIPNLLKVNRMNSLLRNYQTTSQICAVIHWIVRTFLSICICMYICAKKILLISVFRRHRRPHNFLGVEPDRIQRKEMHRSLSAQTAQANCFHFINCLKKLSQILVFRRLFSKAVHDVIIF